MPERSVGGAGAASETGVDVRTDVADVKSDAPVGSGETAWLPLEPLGESGEYFPEGLAIPKIDGSPWCMAVIPIPSDAQFTNGEGQPGVGSPVQEVACNSSLNQKWHVNGQIRYDANSSLCLNRNGADGNGIALNLASCSANAATTEWDYHF